MNILITGAQGQDGIILSEILIKKGNINTKYEYFNYRSSRSRWNHII